jgi:hypothetical protein
MIPKLANFWAFVLLLAGSAWSCPDGPAPDRERLSVDSVLTTASDAGIRSLLESEPGKFHLPDGVIEEKGEEEDNSDPQDSIGTFSPSIPILPASPAPLAIVSGVGTYATLRGLRFTVLRC